MGSLMGTSPVTAFIESAVNLSQFERVMATDLFILQDWHL